MSIQINWHQDAERSMSDQVKTHVLATGDVAIQFGSYPHELSVFTTIDGLREVAKVLLDTADDYEYAR